MAKFKVKMFLLQLSMFCFMLATSNETNNKKNRKIREALSPYFQFGNQPQGPYTYDPSGIYQPTVDTNRNPSNEAHPAFAALLPFVYDGCGNGKGCFGLFDSNCVNHGNCDALVTYKIKGSAAYEFELWAPNSAPGSYVAFGLSSDDKMGEDSVTECSVINGRVNVFSSFNDGKSNSRLSDSNGLRVLETRYSDGNLYCRVERSSPYAINGKTFDLSHGLYILLARGSSSETGVRYHERQKAASKRSVTFAESSPVESSSGVLIKLHGCFMAMAWMFTASCGIVFARYFRLTWVGKQFMDKDLWFVFHSGLMVITWCLTLLAFIIIVAELGGWTSVPTGSNPHALIGLFTTILAFVQPIMAYFRPHPGAPKRYIFNWAHGIVGGAAHLLGTICIFLAVRLDKAAIPYSVTWVLVTYVAIQAVIHAVLTYAPRYFSGNGGFSGAMDMQDMSYQSSQTQSHQMERKEDAPGSKFRQRVLFVYVLLVGSFAAAVIGIIANGPWTR